MNKARTATTIEKQLDWDRNNDLTRDSAISKGQVIYHTIDGKHLKNKISEPVVREVIIYIPPDYHSEPEKIFSSVILLHGYGESAAAWFDSPHTQGFNLAKSMDSLINRGSIDGMIVILPDCSNQFGGSWYTNSTSGGNWEDFIIDELIPFVKLRYQVGKLGIAGHSMGGYGALKLALKNPKIFDAVYAMSSVNLVSDNISKTYCPQLLEKLKAGILIDEFTLFDKLILSKAIAFVPNNASPYYFDFLFQEEGNNIQLDDDVWESWSSHFISRQVDSSRLKNQQLFIAFDHGTDDLLISESRGLSKKLAELGIKHYYSEFKGGHTDRIRSRLENHLIPFFSNNL